MNPQKTSDPVVPPAAHRYLCELELEVKRIPGCNPEEAISDAREFLLSDYDALVRSAEPPDDQSHYDLIVESFGTPKEVANQYKSATVPTPQCKMPGYAPGWRICCTKCGRSAPLAAVGGTRIGAYSVHKYVLGYCHDCKRLRWMRILQDLDQTNLTEMLDGNVTTEQLRKNLHTSVPKLILKILLMIFSLQLVIFLVVGGIVLLSLWYGGVLGASDLDSRTSRLAAIDGSNNAPKGPQQISPGQRPGNAPGTKNNHSHRPERAKQINGSGGESFPGAMPQASMFWPFQGNRTLRPLRPPHLPVPKSDLASN